MRSRNIQIYGIILLVFGASVLAMLEDDIPDRSMLTQVTGQLRSLEKSTSKGGGLSAVRFSLTTDHRYFHYHSSAGHIDKVWTALGQAGYSEIVILIDTSDTHSPALQDRTFYSVLEIRVKNEMIRSYEQVAESLVANNYIGSGIGYGSAIIGSIMLLIPILKRIF